MSSGYFEVVGTNLLARRTFEPSPGGPVAFPKSLSPSILIFGVNSSYPDSLRICQPTGRYIQPNVDSEIERPRRVQGSMPSPEWCLLLLEAFCRSANYSVYSVRTVTPEIEFREFGTGKSLSILRPGEVRNLPRWQFNMHENGDCGAYIRFPIPGMSWHHTRKRTLEWHLGPETASSLIDEAI